jgi:hypothetical protein
MAESAEYEPWQQRAMGAQGWKYKARKRLMDDILSRPVEALNVDVGTVFGKKYYTVEPIGGNWLEMEEWAVSVFGAPSSVWEGTFTTADAGRWYMNDRRFWFREEKDRDWFILKWSS